MKKKEIFLLITATILGLLCFFSYNKSKDMIVLNEVKYTETGSVHYKVHLTDKTYYGADFLDEGMQYISSIIDKIELNYKYNADYEKKDKYVITTNLTANLKIVDTQNEKTIYTKSELIGNNTSTKDKLEVEETIDLDFKKYNQLANEFKTKYGISASCKLSLNYVIQYRDDKTGISQSKLITAEIPLSEQMISVSKNEDINNKGSYIISTTKSSLNNILFIAALVLLVLTSFCVVKLVDTVKKRIESESKYDRFIKKILKEYDAYITTSKSEYIDEQKTKLDISTFKELLDVRNNLEKPIIYYKIDDDNSKFVIISEEIYEFKVSRNQMDK